MNIEKVFNDIAGVKLEEFSTGGGFHSYYHELNTNQDYLLICDMKTQDLPLETTTELILTVYSKDDCVIWEGTVRTALEVEVQVKLRSIFNLWGY